MKSASGRNAFPRYRNFSQRWPDPALHESFRNLFAIYCKVIKERYQHSSNKTTLVGEGYEFICQSFLKASVNGSRHANGRESSLTHDRLAIQLLLTQLKETRSDWLQSVASLLGMLMHFTVDRRKSTLLVNHRRPQKLCSTYPNSPAVARFMGDVIIEQLLKEPIPIICHRSIDAERYAETALRFKVLDPSMESGQLLLEVALAAIRMVQKKHLPQSKTARYLSRAILKKICSECLWGIDRNGQALIAVQSIFSLLGAEFDISRLSITQLVTADALTFIDKERLPAFDGLINNPPWGEVLGSAERKRLRSRFPTLHYSSDTYKAFSELTPRLLRPDGVFALILPSQVIAARNAARLRGLLVTETSMREMILLPRSAFGDATVRGIMLIGRARPRRAVAKCKIVVFPIVKKLKTTDSVQSRMVSNAALRSIGEGSWMSLFNAYTKPEARTIGLERLTTIIPGVKLYCRGCGDPPQAIQVVRRKPYAFKTAIPGSTPAIRGRDVHDFQLGATGRFIKFGKWLAWTGDHDGVRRVERIFVRELCRRDGKITAAIARKDHIPLHGVLTVIPKMIGISPLVCILNSTIAAAYVRSNTASFSKVDFQRITIGELRSLPIPIAAIKPRYRSVLGVDKATKREIALCKQLTVLVRKLLRPTLSVFENQKERAEIDRIVSVMYSLTGDK